MAVRPALACVSLLTLSACAEKPSTETKALPKLHIAATNKLLVFSIEQYQEHYEMRRTLERFVRTTIEAGGAIEGQREIGDRLFVPASIDIPCGDDGMLFVMFGQYSQLEYLVFGDHALIRHRLAPCGPSGGLLEWHIESLREP